MSGSVNRFPPGWDDERVRDVIDHCESQTDDEALAETRPPLRTSLRLR